MSATSSIKWSVAIKGKGYAAHAVTRRFTGREIASRTTIGGDRVAIKTGVKRKLTAYQRKRDFTKTAEPAGGKRAPAKKKHKLKFVLQKHAASHLHFDLRLELDGVMKSWAVPKGPSLDPAIKRLAMEVEDHPMEYNTFEGTIPKGQYGGGTVMLWDRGHYTADKAVDGDHAAAMRKGYEKGKIDFTFHGKRVGGSFALVRTQQRGSKPQWLLIKHRDEYAEPGSDIVAENMTSVTTGRTMEEIAGGNSRVWQSNRADQSVRAKPRKTTTKRKADVKISDILPMLASLGKEMPTGGNWTFEPKYDGIRVLAFIAPGAARLITRNAKDKTAQFPEIVAELAKLPGRSKKPLVLDGEIVALREGEAARFQDLQGRMHVTNAHSIKRLAKEQPAAFIAFDILLDGEKPIMSEPWHVRRAHLEKRLARKTTPHVWLSATSSNGKKMMVEAQKGGWEGVIVKDINAPYQPGKRSKAWQKIKLEKQQEFVVGGFTEPRNSREHIGALLVGFYNDDDELIYAGHVGGGFSASGLKEMYRRLAPRERKTSPFKTTPKTNEKAHWVKPEVVVQVRYNEMTNVGKLRQPVYLGVRDDKDARSVRLEG
jgi:bifunctional non-homologous end joining protein LigD